METGGKPLNGSKNDLIVPWPKLLPKPCKSSPQSHLPRPPFIWKVASSLVVPSVALCAKIWLTYFNRTYVENYQVFLKTLDEHYKSRNKPTNYPLITICNHHSCLDDPGLWGALFPWKWIHCANRYRWTGAAADICFTKKVYTLFFTLGKTFPVIRGGGIDQDAMYFAQGLINQNALVHFFPQGRVVEDWTDKFTNCLRDQDNEDKSYSLRWGLAKLIIDSVSSYGKTITLLPFYHTGMSDALPNTKPYIPRIGNLITISFDVKGPLVIDLPFLEKLFQATNAATIEDKRQVLMNFLENELQQLKSQALRFRKGIISK